MNAAKPRALSSTRRERTLSLNRAFYQYEFKLRPINADIVRKKGIVHAIKIVIFPLAAETDSFAEGN